MTKLSFSNIAWDSSRDQEMYQFLADTGFDGLEIAPTRIFPDQPYQQLDQAADWAKSLKQQYGLSISSMQSIWFGRTENIFASPQDRLSLIDYTKQAIDFAAAIGCPNLVFGSPKNRNIPDTIEKQQSLDIAQEFFGQIATYAKQANTAVALEPNPTIYGTNFINGTMDAIQFAKSIDGLMVNIDTGTIIHNSEQLELIAANIHCINHIHISEPNLAEIQTRPLHQDLKVILEQVAYDKYVSVEMKDPANNDKVKQIAKDIKKAFS